jgi:ribosomal protein L11 methyltransferase
MIQKNNFLQLSANLSQEVGEIFTVVLAEAGFSTFEETETGVVGYIEENLWDEALLKELMSQYLGETPIEYTTAIVPVENWNEEWEKNYPNIYLSDFCQVLPSFREPLPNFEYTIIIDPKMSFGTGHHETTQSVMELMRKMDFKGQTVLDMGCGTGILGILAAMMGAKSVLGIDIDPWCYENGMENVALNHISNMEILCGDVSAIPAQEFDIILANINRHILLADGEYYIKHLKKGGILVLSGFYEVQDEAIITEHYEDLGLKAGEKKVQNDWMAKVFYF